MKEFSLNHFLFRPAFQRPALLAAFVLASAGLLTCAHPDKQEDRLLTHFATGAHPIENGEWPDLTHRATAKVIGKPVLQTFGPGQGLLLNGFTDWLLVAPDWPSAQTLLPKKEFSVAAWVLLNETQNDGGIIGFVQDNGDFEKGWVLGYTSKVFSFGLSTTGADDGNGRLTYLRGQTPIVQGRWHYVVATYDGATMRLYVDGKLDGQSASQTGDILYPERGRYSLGAYVDDNESHFLDGAIYEVKTYGRVMAASEIEGVAQKNQGLLQYVSSINRHLKFVVRPYLQFGTSDSMTVMCETTEPSVMTVEYGEQQPLERSASTSAARQISELALTDLKPRTTYFYRVTCKSADDHLARSDVFSFQTMPAESDPWAFAILGDTQRNPEVTRRCAEGAFGLRPNLLLHCGDVVDDGHAKNQWVDDFLTPVAPLSAYVPVFPVLGNHEKNSHWYYDYFSLPKPEYYYTFRCGNAQFFMIDSNKDCSPGSEQYQWLERELAASKAAWKFTCHHHPCFSSDENDYGDHIQGKYKAPPTWGDPKVRHLIPLYEKYGVDIAFAGHIHSYERTWPILQMSVNLNNGVRYLVSGGGGGGLERAAPQRAWFSLHLQRGHHFCFAAVYDQTLQFKAYDIEGRLFDTFELTKTAKP